jgi:DNA-binding transcriptional LysR family regulator
MSMDFNNLAAFAAVAREKSFTRAAAKLRVSPSALSQTISSLEERLGMRLLTRTTRSVSCTEAGDRLMRTVAPRLGEIELELAAITELRDRPAGTLRITAGEHPAISVLQPALRKFLPDYPDVKVEIIVDSALTDIAAEGYDAGVRMGEQVAKDMIAVRVGPQMRMALVGSPGYFDRHPPPVEPQDLADHNCITTRMPTYGGLATWGLERDGREVKVRAEGQLIFNSLSIRIQSALDGLGLAYVPEDQALSHVAEGRLVRVLEDWCPYFPGYHLYYPSRRHPSPALTLLVDVLRYRGP